MFFHNFIFCFRCFQIENSPLPQSGNNCEVGIGLHKNSLRGIKLARRARSFKDDFLEKISQIRTPTNPIGR